MYTVSAMEMIGLLLWNTGNITHIAKDRNCTANSEEDWLLPTT